VWNHDGNRSASNEELAGIAKLIPQRRQGTFTDADGCTRQTRDDDFMIGAPTTRRSAGFARRFQPACASAPSISSRANRAPTVFFSMATSSGEDVRRNLAFLFSRNCLNVAISRAQCLAYLVCSPLLLKPAVKRSMR
jgi:uncharacterized protein